MRLRGLLRLPMLELLLLRLQTLRRRCLLLMRLRRLLRLSILELLELLLLRLQRLRRRCLLMR